jgi:hypothetical protein
MPRWIFQYQGIDIWNKLPCESKSLPDILVTVKKGILVSCKVIEVLLAVINGIEFVSGLESRDCQETQE